MKVRIVVVDYRGRTQASVDAPEDVQAVEAIIASEGELLVERCGDRQCICAGMATPFVRENVLSG